MGMRHFDVQLIGGMVLHGGNIAEMKTGEGKTLTATLAVCLNALAGHGVHVVTVNDYLARRDAEWMSPIYDLLGFSWGVLQNMQDPDDKIQSYAADITYGTNSEFGFDYLRDNMAQSLEEKVQHGGRIGEDGEPPVMHFFAIVDEVDNILIDEARTPLIISGQPEQAADLYAKFARLAPQMTSGKTPEGMDPRSKKDYVADFDYEFDEKNKTVAVTEQGVAKAEKFLGIDHLYRAENGHLVNHLIQSLKAESLYKRDVDYAVVDDEVDDHRRVHRPHPRRPPLVGGPAPGRRGEGGRARPGGEPDARHDHAAELLPPLRQARRHDRHRAHRGDRVQEDLRARRRPGPDEPADGPRRQERSGLQDPRRQVARRRQRDRGAPREGPAGARRHDLRRGLRAARPAARAQRHPAHRAQRQARVRRARGRDHRRGRRPRRRHDRDQHGRPRRRHQARRQPRAPDAPRVRQARPEAARPRLGADLRADPAQDGGAGRRGPRRRHGGRRPVHRRHRAPRVAPHRQPAARPRRPPGRPRRVALLPLRRGRPRAPLRRRPDLQDPRPPRRRRRRRARGADRGGDADEADREGAEEGRGAELPHPQARPRVRRRHERAAPRRLRLPRRRARRQGPRRAGARRDPRRHPAARRRVHARRLRRGLGPRRAVHRAQRHPPRRRAARRVRRARGRRGEPRPRGARRTAHRSRRASSTTSASRSSATS